MEAQLRHHADNNRPVWISITDVQMLLLKNIKFNLCLLFQRSGRGKGQGEVMPTLDMTLFDWTDYEDMKPVDTWPSSRKKGLFLTLL